MPAKVKGHRVKLKEQEGLVLLRRAELSYEEAELLKRRAEAFLRNSEYLIEVGEWDLAAFNLEQYCQLILKYKLLIKSGSYPRTHSLRELIRRLRSYDERIVELVDDVDNLMYVTKLEDAYIVSRYLPRSYEENEVKAMHRFVKEVFKPIVDKL